MNSVDYTKNLNRQRELFTKDRTEANRIHESELAKQKDVSENKTDSLRTNHKENLARVEKDFTDNVDRVRTAQAKALVENNKQYEKDLEQRKSEFQSARDENLSTWRRKMDINNKEFSDTLKNQDSSNNRNLSEVKSNYEKNFDNFRQASEENFNKFKNNQTKGNRSAQTDSIKASLQKEEDHAAEVKQINEAHTREKNVTLARMTDEMNRMRKDQVKNHIAGHDQRKERFDKQEKDLNSKREDFQRNTISRMKKASQDAILDTNDSFGKQVKDLEQTYNKEVRNIENKQKIKSASDGRERDNFYEVKLESQEERFKDKVEDFTRSSENAKKASSDKISQLTDKFQNETYLSNADNAEKIDKKERQLSRELRDNNYKNKLSIDRANKGHALTTEFNEKVSNERMEHSQNTAKQKVENLKRNFAASERLFQEKAQSDFETNRANTSEEKRELARNLHEENQSNIRDMKDVHTMTIDKLERSYEEKINALESKILTLQENTQAKVEQAKFAIETRMSNQSAKDKRAAEEELTLTKENSKQVENDLRQELQTTKIEHERKISKLSDNFNRKLKQVTMEMSAANQKNNIEKQQENDTNQRFFNRELDRIKMATTTERETLIGQYESRIKEMQKIYRDNLNEVRDLNSLEQPTKA